MKVNVQSACLNTSNEDIKRNSGKDTALIDKDNFISEFKQLLKSDSKKQRLNENRNSGGQIKSIIKNIHTTAVSWVKAYSNKTEVVGKPKVSPKTHRNSEDNERRQFNFNEILLMQAIEYSVSINDKVLLDEILNLMDSRIAEDEYSYQSQPKLQNVYINENIALSIISNIIEYEDVSMLMQLMEHNVMYIGSPNPRKVVEVHSKQEIQELSVEESREESKEGQGSKNINISENNSEDSNESDDKNDISEKSSQVEDSAEKSKETFYHDSDIKNEFPIDKKVQNTGRSPLKAANNIFDDEEKSPSTNHSSN